MYLQGFLNPLLYNVKRSTTKGNQKRQKIPAIRPLFY